MMNTLGFGPEHFTIHSHSPVGAAGVDSSFMDRFVQDVASFMPGRPAAPVTDSPTPLAATGAFNGATVTDENAYSNTGVRVTINAPPLNGGHQYNIIEYMSNLVGVELGMQDWPDGTLRAYYYVFNPEGGGVFAYNNNFKKLDPDVPHTFEVSLSHGTTWALKIDDKPAAHVDMGTAESDAVGGPGIVALTEFGSTPQQTVEFSNFQYLKNDTWSDVAHGAFITNGNIFPTEGNLQNPAIAPAGFETGASLASSVTINTPLW